jgi:Rrf2 family protein
MNKINRKLEYALMALKLMSLKVPGELTTAKEVVDETGSPFDATARVLQVMAHKGLLKSEQGAHGGYLIVRDLSKLSLHELGEMVLGPTGVAKCLHGAQACELADRCNILSPMEILNRKIVEFYKTLSVADLLKVKERDPLTKASARPAPPVEAKEWQ